MKRATISGGAFVSVLVLLVLAENHRALEQDVDARAATSPATTSSTASTEQVDQGFLYGRVTTDDGATYQGRLRFGGDEEAFWGNYFNGFKGENPWATHAPPERLTQKRRPITIFGFEIPLGERQIDLGRPFMARFGDIARIEARGRDVRVTLKSGTVFDLDRNAANDFDDGVRVWDDRRGVVDLAVGRGDTTSARVRSAPSSSSPPPGWAPPPPGCTVRCARGTATSRASFNGTGRSASAPTNSSAAPPTVSSASASTPSAPSRAARATARW